MDQVEVEGTTSLVMPLGVGAAGESGGSGVDIFIESGDCDLEFGNDFSGRGPLFSTFRMTDGPSGIDDRI